MTMTTTKTLPQVLDSLSRETTLQVLAHVQRRQARDAVLAGLLQARLASLTSAPVKTQDTELLTADEAAARLKLSRPRVYELVRQGRLPKIKLGEEARTVRI